MTPWLENLLVHLLEDDLPDHPDGVHPKLQVYDVLRFLAEGHYQKGIGADFNHCMSQPTFSKYLQRVIPAINQLTPEFIRFPQTAEERNLVQERLFFDHYFEFLYQHIYKGNSKKQKLILFR